MLGKKKNDIKKFYFSETIAKDVGVEEAIMLHNLYFWVEHNEKRGINFHKGKYWTFDTVKTYAEKYPYWSTSAIRRILRNLEARGYIETGSFNKFGPDRTKWYTVTAKYTNIIKKKEGLLEKTYLSDENDTPIPHSIPR